MSIFCYPVARAACRGPLVCDDAPAVKRVCVDIVAKWILEIAYQRMLGCISAFALQLTAAYCTIWPPSLPCWAWGLRANRASWRWPPLSMARQIQMLRYTSSHVTGEANHQPPCWPGVNIVSYAPANVRWLDVHHSFMLMCL